MRAAGDDELTAVVGKRLVQRTKPWTGIPASDVAAVMAMGASWDTGLIAADISPTWANIQHVQFDYRGGAIGTGCDKICSPESDAHIETLAMLLRRYSPKL